MRRWDWRLIVVRRNRREIRRRRRWDVVMRWNGIWRIIRIVVGNVIVRKIRRIERKNRMVRRIIRWRKGRWRRVMKMIRRRRLIDI